MRSLSDNQRHLLIEMHIAGTMLVTDGNRHRTARSLRRQGLAESPKPATWHLSAHGHEIARNLCRSDAVDAAIQALEDADALIDDMSRFVGQMALKNYARFNRVPLKIAHALKLLRVQAALAKARGQEAGDAGD